MLSAPHYAALSHNISTIAGDCDEEESGIRALTLLTLLNVYIELAC